MSIFDNMNRDINNFFAAADTFIEGRKIMSDAEMDKLEQHFGAHSTAKPEPEPFVSTADQIVAGCWILAMLTCIFIL